MSETEEVNTQLTKKLNTANKNIKLLMEMVKTLEEKVDAMKTATPQTPEEKEKLNEIFEKKGWRNQREILQRNRNSIWECYVVVKSKNLRHQPWTTTKLLKTLMETMSWW